MATTPFEREPATSFPAITLEAPGARFMRMGSDYMMPTLRVDDYVAVMPTDRWHYDTLYVLEVLGASVVYRCQHIGGGQIRITHDRHPADGQVIPIGRFRPLVLGIVVATCNVLDVNMLERGRI
ncbi:hypothetical protein ACELLULO517_27460 [Acidisoma cellulosilytica]|uniref:Peptidase S24/S26A/S26B/S26C domain-containing protein n=1 Tax=Acidisoma cellulosilyticum TaxID=2802395 RepID=A0A963Z7M2_9PROT|nr:hypothetical protein [Acidisoma cellulosilyticum]MCB8884006.1 hypothetical protein [Acidisoma cellulosilyticum]